MRVSPASRLEGNGHTTRCEINFLSGHQVARWHYLGVQGTELHVGWTLAKGYGDTREQADKGPLLSLCWTTLRCIFFLQLFWRIPESWANTPAERPVIGKTALHLSFPFSSLSPPETIWAVRGHPALALRPTSAQCIQSPTNPTFTECFLGRQREYYVTHYIRKVPFKYPLSFSFLKSSTAQSSPFYFSSISS